MRLEVWRCRRQGRECYSGTVSYSTDSGPALVVRSVVLIALRGVWDCEVEFLMVEDAPQDFHVSQESVAGRRKRPT